MRRPCDDFAVGDRDPNIHTAPTLAKAIETLSAGTPVDLVLLDFDLPDVKGLDGLVRLCKAVDLPVVVVPSMAETRIISSAIHAGASGFIPKHSQRDTFAQAVTCLEQGEPFVPAGYDLLEEQPSDDPTNRLASLTTQQTRILQLICEGKLNKQIAYDLSIAETTVKAHVTAIMRKLGVQSRTQAVLIAKQASFANVLQDSGPPA